MNRLQALALLAECTGRDIWSVEHCRRRRVPETWIDDLSDCFESGFLHDLQTIYHEDRVLSQYEGVRDIDLAKRLAEFLQLDVARVTATALTPESYVRAIKEAVDE